MKILETDNKTKTWIESTKPLSLIWLVAICTSLAQWATTCKGSNPSLTCLLICPLPQDTAVGQESQEHVLWENLKNNRSISSDEGLMLETSAPPFTLRWYNLLNQFVSLSQFIVFQFPTDAAAVSLETNPTILDQSAVSEAITFSRTYQL